MRNYLWFLSILLLSSLFFMCHLSWPSEIGFMTFGTTAATLLLVWFYLPLSYLKKKQAPAALPNYFCYIKVIGNPHQKVLLRTTLNQAIILVEPLVTQYNPINLRFIVSGALLHGSNESFADLNVRNGDIIEMIFDSRPGTFDHVLVSELKQSFKQFLCERLVGEWQTFVRKLPFNEVSNDKIDQITDDNKKSSERCFQAFHTWCQSNPTAQWKHVQDVLEKIGQKQLIAECVEEFASISNEKEKVELKKRIGFASEELRKIYKKKHKDMERLVHNSTQNKLVNRNDVYVDLKINSSDVERKEWDKFVDRDCYITQRNNAEDSKQMKDFFKGHERLIIVSGIAGIGKTTLLVHSVMQWVEKKQWEEFDFVFHIICREINHLHNKSLEELLVCLYPSVMNKIPFEKLSEIPNRVLFIVDGIDEFMYLSDLVKISTGGGNVEKIAEAVYSAINPDYLIINHRSIVAGRPESAWRIKIIFHLDPPLCIDVVGFDSKSTEKFITNRFGGNKMLQVHIKDIINQSPTMQIMATVPIYLEVMCSILEDNDKATFSTLTELYIWVLFYYVQKHFKAKQEARFIHMTISELFRESDILETLYCVCKMSYEMLKEGCIVFDSSSFGEIPGGSLEYCGLVTKVSVSQLEEVYQFRHLSIMEFCSAVHIFKNLNSEMNTVLKSSRLKGCISVVCGLEGAFQNNTGSPPIVKKFVNALKLEKQTSLWMRSILQQNKEAYINWIDDVFIASFFESRSYIPDEFNGQFSKSYNFDIDSNSNAIKLSQQFYFVEKLYENDFLSITRLIVKYGKTMSIEMQKILAKVLYSSKTIDIEILPVDFDGDLFARTISSLRSSRKSLPESVSIDGGYSNISYEQFSMLLPIVSTIEDLWLSRICHWSKDNWLDLSNVLVSSNHVKKFRVGDCGAKSNINFGFSLHRNGHDWKTKIKDHIPLLFPLLDVDGINY